MAPRWTYIDPAIAFNPLLSFQVVIMALLGGAGALFGPLLGVVPLVLLFEVLTANFPNDSRSCSAPSSSSSSTCLPRGVIGLLRRAGVRRVRGSRRDAGAGALRATARRRCAVDGLRKSFGGLRAVDGSRFRVEPGEIVGLIGPNGSGKTTVLNLISGALKAGRRRIRFHGPADRRRAARIASRVLGVARTFQLVRVLDSMSCCENVRPPSRFAPCRLTGRRRARLADGLLARVGLADKADLPAAELTYIDQKRLELARALALEPKLLLLDEWLAGLNPTELEEGIALIHSLRREGITIVMVEHVMDAIRSLCDRCVVMNAGRKIAEGPPHASARRAGGRARLSRRRRCLRCAASPSPMASTWRSADVALDVRRGEIVVDARRQRGRQDRRCSRPSPDL